LPFRVQPKPTPYSKVMGKDKSEKKNKKKDAKEVVGAPAEAEDVEMVDGDDVEVGGRLNRPVRV